MADTTLIIDDERSLKRTVLFVMSAASFIISFSGSACNLALPTIGREFNASAIALGWVISGFVLSSSIFLLPFGRLGDIIGMKKIFSLGMLLFAASTFFISLSWNIVVLISFRLLQGISAAMLFSTSIAIITTAFPPGERGRALGINVTLIYLGFSMGPVLGGLLTQYFGWRSIFGVLVPFQAALFILSKLKIKREWADAASEKFDLKGSIVYGIGLLSFMYGFSSLPALKGWICLSAGLVLLVLFGFIELRTASPVFEVRLILTNRIFTFSSAAALINYAATNAIGFFISLYLQYPKGFDARTAGLIMISRPLAQTLFSPVAGRLSDKVNPGKLASVGMGIISIGLILFCFINENTHIAYLVALLLLVGVGFGLFSSPNQYAIMSSVEKKYLGIASGVLGTARHIGQMTSMSIAMLLLSLYIGKETITPAVYPGLITTIRTGFLIFAILSGLGILASLARNKRN